MKSTKGLANKRSDIRTFVCFAILGGAREYVGKAQSIAKMAKTLEQADRLLDFFSHPEHFPKDLYPTLDFVVKGKPIDIRKE